MFTLKVPHLLKHEKNVAKIKKNYEHFFKMFKRLLQLCCRLL